MMIDYQPSIHRTMQSINIHKICVIPLLILGHILRLLMLPRTYRFSRGLSRHPQLVYLVVVRSFTFNPNHDMSPIFYLRIAAGQLGDSNMHRSRDLYVNTQLYM